MFSVAAAFEMHREIEAEWDVLDPAQRPEMLAFVARGHATLSRAVLDDGRVRVTKSEAEGCLMLGGG